VLSRFLYAVVPIIFAYSSRIFGLLVVRKSKDKAAKTYAPSSVWVRHGHEIPPFSEHPFQRAVHA